MAKTRPVNSPQYARPGDGRQYRRHDFQDKPDNTTRLSQPRFACFRSFPDLSDPTLQVTPGFGVVAGGIPAVPDFPEVRQVVTPGFDGEIVGITKPDTDEFGFVPPDFSSQFQDGCFQGR